MKVYELIEEIEHAKNRAIQEGMSEEEFLDLEVAPIYDYGDRCHTMVVANFDSLEVSEVVYSDYHGRDKLNDPESRFYEDANSKKALVFSEGDLVTYVED